MIEHLNDKVAQNLKNGSFNDAIFFAEKSLNLSELRLNQISLLADYEFQNDENDE
jgi:hypothetical protein